MAWTISPYTKGEVNRAGRVLASTNSTADERVHAIEVMSTWRAAHAYPMHALLIMLRRKSADIDDCANVVQRHKRAPSIIEKLSRFPEMELGRMQDIGGCRAILTDVEDVERLSDHIQQSRIHHKLHRIYDYITEPKDSGYRGIHLVYKYYGAKTEYNGYFVELQLRSKIQHAWSTAVEIVDTFTRQSLKSGVGQPKWKKFFRIASAEFAKLEARPTGCDALPIDTKAELLRLRDELRVPDRLGAFATVAQHFPGLSKRAGKQYEHFLLELNHAERNINVVAFRSSEINAASKAYNEKEYELRENPDIEVVLVAASSMNALEHAYPNYFADSTQFIRYIKNALARGNTN